MKQIHYIFYLLFIYSITIFGLTNSAKASLRVCNNSGENLQITAVLREPMDYFFDKWDNYEWRNFEGCVNFFAGEQVQVDAFFLFRKPKFLWGWDYLTSNDFRIEEVKQGFFGSRKATIRVGTRSFCVPNDSGSRENTAWDYLLSEQCPTDWSRRSSAFYVDVPSNIYHAIVNITGRQVQLIER